MQKIFADEYIKTGHVTNSAIKAGYKHPRIQGAQNLSKLNIKEYIENRTAKVIERQEEKTIATQEDALKKLSEMILGGFATQTSSKKIKRYEEDDKGNPTAVEETITSIRPSDIVKAIELMGKLQGWGSGTEQEELNAVDKLLRAMEGFNED